ncbi:hypothetical protein SAMN05446037_100519 [Anaerovirgula multivorans]|uniref:Cxxc_20_cxxc protein n=1 Tax=Anaerovirgula multivorans TaxID=312168 RepID=A0A239C676_9FIRM|nr:hypothetical protein [Anaerovirgula multivorans]SNS15429.1 hypothetical protein SAMN05446037_100519 [Anaerovirgula multivorans]
MNTKKLYGNSKCPSCGKYCITYKEKMKLIDYRFTHECKECGGTIQLPAWHALLFLSELGLMLFLAIKFNLNTWQAITLGLALYLFIRFIQLPFIPIKG